jgi:hypothetical protein
MWNYGLKSIMPRQARQSRQIGHDTQTPYSGQGTAYGYEESIWRWCAPRINWTIGLSVPTPYWNRSDREHINWTSPPALGFTQFSISPYLSRLNLETNPSQDIFNHPHHRSSLMMRKSRKSKRSLTAAMSRIMNDMLLGAIATSTGLWVIGIIVMVSYLVITAWRGEKGRMGEYEVELR